MSSRTTQFDHLDRYKRLEDLRSKTISALNKRGEVVLKVTTTEMYSFPRGSINNWDVDTVVEDWFGGNNMCQYHETRDYHKIGGCPLVSRVEIFEPNR